MSTPAETESKPESPVPADTPMAGSEEDVKPQAESQVEPQVEPQVEAEPEPVDLEKLRADFQEKAKTYLIEQSRHVLIPSFARWFDMNVIHDIEKKSFPDFFPVESSDDVPPSVYKTPENYQNMRDFMINTYRINPIEYLTVTAVRRNLAGDVASIIRIHRFLEKWGLINYQIDPRTKPSLVGPQYTGHFQITLDTPKGLTPLVPEELAVVSGESTETQNQDAPAAREEAAEPVKQEVDAPTIPINMEITRNIFDENKTAKGASSVAYFCNETSNDISDVRYHNLKSKASAAGTLGPSVISKECWEQGLFPSNFTASDFVKLEKAQVQAEWTQQEVLLLLEGIEMFGSLESNPQSLFVNSNGQWDKISEHVASKSRDECLVKFLQFPIEDRYLQKLIKTEKKEAPTSGLDKDTIIQEVIGKLVQTTEGKQLLTETSKQNLEKSLLDQTNLINQVIELTVEKFETKLQFIDRLEADLIKKENLLNLQRKQVLVERWANFEKVHKFKTENNNPELASLLDDLLTPVNVNDLNQGFDKINLEQSVEKSAPQSSEGLKQEISPVSVAQPKAYQFWSA